MTAASPCLDPSHLLRVSCADSPPTGLPAFYAIDSSQSHHPQYLSPDCRWFTRFVPRKGRIFWWPGSPRRSPVNMTKAAASWWPRRAPASASPLLCPGRHPGGTTDQKKLVISTATVALQEQLIHRTCRSTIATASCRFASCWSKGRQRYCCEHLLEQAAQGSDGPTSSSTLAP